VSRRPAAVTQADIARAVRVAKKERAAVEIKPDGTILIRTDVEGELPNPHEPTEPIEPEKVIVF
jgi:dUTPase